MRGRHGTAWMAGPGTRRGEVLRPDDGGRDAGDGRDVTGGVVPDSGHWIMEENPLATIGLVRPFLMR